MAEGMLAQYLEPDREDALRWARMGGPKQVLDYALTDPARDVHTGVRGLLNWADRPPGDTIRDVGTGILGAAGIVPGPGKAGRVFDAHKSARELADRLSKIDGVKLSYSPNFDRIPGVSLSTNQMGKSGYVSINFTTKSGRRFIAEYRVSDHDLLSDRRYDYNGFVLPDNEKKETQRIVDAVKKRIEEN